MIELTVKEVAEITGGKLFSNKENSLVNGFSIDSRTISPGQFFIAVKGGNFDGHDYISDALKKGAGGLIAERHAGDVPHETGHIIMVDNTRQAMGMIASEIRNKVDIPVVCITGTNGKTTLKEILCAILSRKYKVLKSRKSYNNIIGLSLTLFDLDLTYEAAVLELGTNCSGEIPKLAGIAAPHIAVITNIGDGHLEHFINREGVFFEKIRLLDFLPSTGIAFLNKDDSLLAKTSVRNVYKKFYGMTKGCDLLISGIKSNKGGSSFVLNGKDYFIPAAGEHNVYNAAAAIGVAECFGLDHEEICEGLRDVSLPGMRMEEVNVKDVIFINDSYNSNPDSFECALDVLKNDYPDTMKGVVAGDMLELGRHSEEFHRTIGRSIAARGLDFLIAMGDLSKHMIEGAVEYGMDRKNVLYAVSHEDAVSMLSRFVDSGTVVLLKGSRETKMEEILKCYITTYTP